MPFNFFVPTPLSREYKFTVFIANRPIVQRVDSHFILDWELILSNVFSRDSPSIPFKSQQGNMNNDGRRSPLSREGTSLSSSHGSPGSRETSSPRVPAGAALSGSDPPREPPVVNLGEPPVVVSTGRSQRGDYPVYKPAALRPGHAHLDGLVNWLGSESYGAPRVFDLFTMLAVTLAFALMFALLQLLQSALFDSLEIVALALSLFVTGIAIAQLALWEGKKPRLASLVAGPVVWFFVSVGIQIFHLSLTFPELILLLIMSVLGFPAGYLAGAMVAGVFLVADVLRRRILKSADNQVAESDDAVFEVPPTSGTKK